MGETGLVAQILDQKSAAREARSALEIISGLSRSARRLPTCTREEGALLERILMGLTVEGLEKEEEIEFWTL